MADNDLQLVSENRMTIKSKLLTTQFNPQSFIEFIARYHTTTTGNVTLLSTDNYSTFSKIGTICSYLEKRNKLQGIIFSVILTLNIGKSGYTTFLCLRHNQRGRNYAKELILANIAFGSRLGINHGYYLGDISRRKGVEISSWYRVLDYEEMTRAGFPVIKSRKLALRTYTVKYVRNFSIKKGLHTDLVNNPRLSIYWNPSQSELKKMVEQNEFYTIFHKETAVAIVMLFPVYTVIGRTGRRIKLAMVSYLHIIDMDKEEKIFQLIINQASRQQYHGLYGYSLGNMSEELLQVSNCHITGQKYILDFFNHKEDIPCTSDINIPLF